MTKRNATPANVSQAWLDQSLWAVIATEMSASSASEWIDRGANPRSRDSRGLNALEQAIQLRRADFVARLAPCCDLEEKGLQGRTPLGMAAWQGCAECARALLNAGANPSDVAMDGSSALMLAAASGEVACARELLEASDPLAQDDEGWTALMRAVRHNGIQCVRLLLPVSDAKAKDESGMDALMSAACGWADMVQELLAASDPKAKEEHGETALMKALKEAAFSPKGLDCARILIPASDLDAVDADGKSVDDWACELQEDDRKVARGLIAAERDRRALAETLLGARRPARAGAQGNAIPEDELGAKSRPGRRL